MKRHYKVQIVIDITIIIISMLVYLFPEISNFNANVVFYTLMSIYAGLELLEYILGKNTLESLYLFIISAVCAFSGFFLKNYPPDIVLSITLSVWILMLSIVKIIFLERIYEKKTRLFIIKLACTSAIILVGILVSINIYYKISNIGYMLALMYLSYGFLELMCDTLDYLSDDVKFLKE